MNILDNFTKECKTTIIFFKDSIKGIKSSGISSGFIESFSVNNSLIKYIANVIPDKGKILVKPYDVNDASRIEKKLKESGIDCYLYSKETVLVPIPVTTGEEKEKCKNKIKALGEDAKVSIRNIRKKVRNNIPKTLSKDEIKDLDTEIQQITDCSINDIDKIIKEKISSF